MNTFVNLVGGSDILKESTKRFSCDKHGSFEYTAINGYFNALDGQGIKCPKCHAETILAKEKSELLEDLKKRKKLVSIPEKYQKASFDNWIIGSELQKPIINRLEEYVSSFNRKSKNIVMFGSTGTGKTRLACTLLNHLSVNLYPKNQRMRFKFIRSSDIQRGVKATWSHQTNETEKGYLNNLSSYDILVIDEIGVSDNGNGDIERLGGLLDSRYQNKPTIITTNLSEKELNDYIGDRAFDRIAESAIFIDFKWRSYRKRTQQMERF